MDGKIDPTSRCKIELKEKYRKSNDLKRNPLTRFLVHGPTTLATHIKHPDGLQKKVLNFRISSL